MEYKISVIVPIYNVESYVNKCIESICNQTYQNLEIILVDDGATDSSGIICDKWEKQDSRIKVFHIQNGGQSRARNIGLTHATGELIGFVDGDDAIIPGMYSRLVHLLDENQAEIAECNFYGRKSKEPDSMKEKEINVISGREALTQHLAVREKRRFPSTSVWSKLFRKEIIQDLRFPEGKVHEEYAFLCQAMFRCRCYVYLNERLYQRTLRDDSTTAEPFSERSFDKLDVYRLRDAFLYEANEKEFYERSLSLRYDLLLHYYNQAMQHEMKAKAKEVVSELKGEKWQVLNSFLPLKRKIKLALLIFWRKGYDFILANKRGH